MEDSRLQVGEEDYANILLGIFIPTQIVNGKKAKKRKPASGTANCGNGIESSGKSRKRRFSSDHFVEDSRLKSKRQKVPEVKELSHNKGEEVEVKSVSHKKMKKRPKNGRKQSQDSSSTSAKTATDREDALDYLHRWDWGISSWTFRKKTQYWLLQNACNKSQVPKAEFKILLRYMEALKGNQRQLTVARAQRIVSEFQSEDSTVNNRMHKRALAVLKVLS